jgi:hypothetical protein
MSPPSLKFVTIVFLCVAQVQGVAFLHLNLAIDRLRIHVHHQHVDNSLVRYFIVVLFWQLPFVFHPRKKD